MAEPEAIIAEARGWIGTPYHHQASLKGVGCDCIGLIRGIWRGVYGTGDPEAAPAYSADWGDANGSDDLVAAARRHMQEIDIAEAAAGDVLGFRWKRHLPVKHAGVLVAGQLASCGRLVHAYTRSPVSEISLSPWWQARAAVAFRFP